VAVVSDNSNPNSIVASMTVDADNTIRFLDDTVPQLENFYILITVDPGVYFYSDLLSHQLIQGCSVTPPSIQPNTAGYTYYKMEPVADIYSLSQFVASSCSITSLNIVPTASGTAADY
jgi:hypothetical protein